MRAFLVTGDWLHGIMRFTSLGITDTPRYVCAQHNYTRLPRVDWNKALFYVIDMRSFSSIWYWIAIAVLWSSMSHWVLGVPYDLISRARRLGGEVEQDLIDCVRVNVNRTLAIVQKSGLWLLGIACFANSSLFILGAVYRVEMAQAIFLMVFPLSLVGALVVATARKIEAHATDVDALHHMLNRHRLWTQVIGMISIFFTAMYGMYHNLAVPAF